MAKIHLLVGVPASGKTWVTDQLKDKYQVIEHDLYKLKPEYVSALLRAAASNTQKPILANTPFGMSEIQSALTSKGHKVEPIYILEDPKTLQTRYKARQGTDIPKGHLTRQETYRQRADETKAFKGTSADVLNHLQTIKEET